MLSKDGPAIWIDFAEFNRLESSRSLKAEGEATDAGKEVEDTQHLAFVPIEGGNASTHFCVHPIRPRLRPCPLRDPARRGTG